MDVEPVVCIRCDHWRQAGLAIPPEELINHTNSRNQWTLILEYLRTCPCALVHKLRLLLIGDGEVGKTTLIRSICSPNYQVGHIATDVKTIGLPLFSTLQLPASDGESAVTCELCDCPGEQSCFLSQSLSFSRQTLFMLTWTPCKFREDGSARVLAIGDIVAPLKRWLYLLADTVPEATVAVVGTHCMVDPEAFHALQTQVDREICDEIDRLGTIADCLALAIRKELDELEQYHIQRLQHVIFTTLTSLNLPIKMPLLQPADVELFCRALRDMRPKPSRSLLLHADALLKAVLLAKGTKHRLRRMHSMHGGSPSYADQDAPLTPHQVAHLKLISSSQDGFKSFAVDSIVGIGVAHLLQAVAAACKNPGAARFTGERAPVAWLQAKAALQQQPVQVALGDSVLPLADAVLKLSSVLQTELGFDVGLARRLDHSALQCCIVNFLSPLGIVLVHNGFFLRDPRLITEGSAIDRLQPTIHYDVQSRISLLFFFNDCYTISDFDCVLVAKSRLCKSSDVWRQQAIHDTAVHLESSSHFHAAYVLPLHQCFFVTSCAGTCSLSSTQASWLACTP